MSVQELSIQYNVRFLIRYSFYYSIWKRSILNFHCCLVIFRKERSITRCDMFYFTVLNGQLFVSYLNGDYGLLKKITHYCLRLALRLCLLIIILMYFNIRLHCWSVLLKQTSSSNLLQFMYNNLVYSYFALPHMLILLVYGYQIWVYIQLFYLQSH